MNIGGGKSEHHPPLADKMQQRLISLPSDENRREVRTVTMLRSYSESETAKSLLGARTNQEKGIRL